MFVHGIDFWSKWCTGIREGCGDVEAANKSVFSWWEISWGDWICLLLAEVGPTKVLPTLFNLLLPRAFTAKTFCRFWLNIIFFGDTFSFMNFLLGLCFSFSLGPILHPSQIFRAYNRIVFFFLTLLKMP